ncbi:MAG: nucleotidyltransferase domain-containing protein [Candidatus Omnitrophota bacterium]|nr:nucleotidyltransferase domain-containing protein [Candidatus Omnitrophota bacterium]
MRKNVLIATNSQKILDFLIEHPIKDFLAAEIQQATGISKSGVNYALRDLADNNFILRLKRGNLYFYTVEHKSPVIKQLKISKTILQIEKLLKKLEKLSSKIILFGSCSRGENTLDSDIDLCIISRNKEEIMAEIKRYKTNRKIQSVIRTNLQFVEMEKTDPIFYGQVFKGIVLWEGNNNDV